MRKLRNIILIIIAMTSIFSSCQDFRYVYTVDNLEIEMDWSDLSKNAEPNGASIIFYPVNGNGIYAEEQTNEISLASVYVIEGTYDVVVFNNTPSEFSTLNFSGMDDFNTFEIYSKGTNSKWYTSKSEEDKLVMQPETFAVATIKNLEVTKDMIENSYLKIAPKNIIQNAKIRINVIGIQNAHSARASISGMAHSYNIAENKTGSEKVTYLLENWAIKKNEGSYTEGELYTDFSSLGLTNSSITRGEQGQYIFKMEILLIDNKTIAKVERDITDKILSLPWNKGSTITIDIGFGNEEAIILPDVKPAGGSEGGFDADVEDWGSNENIDIIL